MLYEVITKSQKYKIRVVEGIDSGGEDGIYTFTKSQTMHEIMSDVITSYSIHYTKLYEELYWSTEDRKGLGSGRRQRDTRAHGATSLSARRTR